ncbi:NUDIX hydrolase [Amycolatopsis panacis]|uniref:NUDIX hydrolase n=1 Tax=Amycolatopsis panacis TaxID=2340917 RepID=A0A419HXE0_9PSEU|nr:NUDIX hydrolase [Amycolatopsis panacis]RJQ81702.1 NUDIX hydrolase [Amycolatopsis panacis]
MTRWTVHGSHRIYTSPWLDLDLDLVELPDGKRIEHHVIRFPRGSVGAVVAESDHILLLWRHRFITDTWGWEVPAGWAEDGEDPVAAVRREVVEETGYRPEAVEPLVSFAPLIGISSHRFEMFVASGGPLVNEPDSIESTKVQWLPLADIPRLVAMGQISDGPSLTALAYYQLRHHAHN